MKNKNKKQEIFSSYFFTKNKKGNLLPEEVLKIVVAVICIGFLIFLLVSLYFSLTGGQKKKEAEASMNLISKEIIRIDNDGEYNSQGFPVPNPSGWYIFSFTEGEIKPNLCAGENCICICENVWLNQNLPFNNWQKRQVERCDDKGSCTVVSNLKKFDKIKIEKGGIAILIGKINSEIQITKKSISSFAGGGGEFGGAGAN